MKKLFTLILLCVVAACTALKEPVEEPFSTTPAAPATGFRTLPNPYSLANMQYIYDSLAIQVTLKPTDLYVRFLPRDSVQLNELMYDYHLELFSYPLDLYIEEGKVYVDPEIPEGGFTWFYTTVKPDFVFPANIRHEILEQCYIPSKNEAMPITRAGVTYHFPVEEMAFKRLGYKVEPRTRTASSSSLSGTVHVSDSIPEPLQGVKIRCNTVVKWATACTDENGHYEMAHDFLVWPHYEVFFDNSKGFDVWGNWGPLAPATYSMGFHNPAVVFHREIPFDSRAWEWAVVNNAAYEYYRMCETTGIAKPPSHLKIFAAHSLRSSAAPMLRRINHPIGYNGENDWVNFFVNLVYGTTLTVVNQLLRAILPDVVVGTNSNKIYQVIYGRTHHELSHASHFSQAGSAFWAKYISYVATYGLGESSYGDGSGHNAEVCGVGEMWGFAMGHIQECEKYDKQRFNKSYSDSWYNYWFKPDVVWDLFRNGILTKKQIFDCLTADVDTFSKLMAKMHELYPDVVGAIDATFNKYRIFYKE